MNGSGGGGGEKRKRNPVLLVGLILWLCLIAFIASFIGVTVNQYNRIGSIESNPILTEEELREIEERIAYLNSTILLNNTELQQQVEELRALIDSLVMQLGETNATLRQELEDLRTSLDLVNTTLTEDINELIISNTTQQEEIDQLRMELTILQSQFALFLEQLMNGTFGGGGGGGMMTLPPANPGSAYVNFNSTPFIIDVFGPNCCASLTSGRTDIYTFDYLGRGQTVGTANVTQTILQWYFGVAFRMIDGLVLEPGSYNIDLHLDITRLSGTGSASFFVAWLPSTWWNTPIGIDFTMPTIFASQVDFANFLGISNTVANIPITNPAGTQSVYMSINNFFVSTGVESLFIMSRQNPMGGGSSIQINSFEVRFNRI